MWVVKRLADSSILRRDDVPPGGGTDGIGTGGAPREPHEVPSMFDPMTGHPVSDPRPADAGAAADERSLDPGHDAAAPSRDAESMLSAAPRRSAGGEPMFAAEPGAPEWVPARYQPAPPPSSRRGGIRVVIGAALLSAALASGSTLAIVAATNPWQATAAPVAASPAATSNAKLAVSTTTTSTDDTAAIARATASTVTITTQETATGFVPGTTQQATGVGSGVVLTANGLILTNYHVVQGATSLRVLLPDGSTATATVVKTDPTHDLAIIQAKATGLTPATLATASSIEIGQTVYAIGSPLGQYTDSVTRGIVSATNRTITVSDSSTRETQTLSGLIQTDAAINPGNSGGPLIDSQGRVVGIATAGSQSAEGIGFAIPISAASSIIAQAEASAA